MSKRPPHATYVEVPTPESSRLQSATTPSRSKHEEQSSTGPSHPPLIRETSQIRAAFNSFTGLGDDESAFEERQKWNQRRLRRISNKYNCKLDELSKELNSGDQRGGSATVAGTPMSVIGTPAVFDPFHSVESGVTPTIRGFFNARSTRGSFAVPQTPLQRSMASAGNVHRFPATPGVAPESSTTFGSFQQEPRMSGRTPKRQDSVPKIFFESFSAFLKTGSVTPQRRRPPPLTSRSSFDIEQINEREFMQEDVLDRLAEENSPSGIVFRMSETQPRTAGEQIALVQLGQRDPSSSGSLDQTGKSSMAASSRFRTTIEGVPTESVITEETSFELDEDERDAPGPSSSSWSSRSGGRRGRRPHRFPVSQPIFDDSSMSATAALEPLIEEKERPSEEDEGKSSRIPHSKSQPASIQRYKTFDEDIRRPSDLMQGSTLLEHSKSLPQGFPGREIPETRAPASAVEAMEAQSAEQDFKTKILRPFKSFKRTLSRKKTSADGGKGVHENPGVPPTPQPTSKHHKVMSSKTVSVNEEMFFDKVPPTPAKPMRISLMPQEVDAYHPDAASPPRTPFVFDVVPDDVPSIDGAPLAAQPFAMSDVAGISRIALGDAHIVRAQRARLGPHPIAPSVGEPDRPTSQTIDSTATRKMLQRQKSIDRSAFLEAHMDRFAMAVQKHNPEQRQHRKKARIRGIGRLGRCIGRNLQKSKVSRLPENLRNRIEEGEDERVFFTYWVTTIQILVCLMSILFYGLGPFGLDRVEKHGEVMDTTLTYRRVSFHEPVHFWMGPNFADLIRLGAKYSPCMRRERNLWKVIEEERQQENKTGCCIYNDNSGCYQTGKNACPRSLATWNRWDQKGGPLVRRTSGPVCGQDPEYCDEPQSHALSEWPDDLTQWPICTKTRSGGFLPRHMTCPVTGRPCCIQVQGLCRITTKEYCTFVRGHYHENATLCSQVDCLSDVCGMLPFFNKDHPNQLYRLFVSLFLHAGYILTKKV
ncbi:unnamed protein product [Caenorhabditis auriculariae]|uniref:Uncharacterized protein n=1 Tax=Caenorhabditis auriculariae TaxID=2777116 RepID=A0A8S1HT87_9PELO|nr:unnamed protein product [Caenorhabditis auriculariae]